MCRQADEITDGGVSVSVVGEGATRAFATVNSCAQSGE